MTSTTPLRGPDDAGAYLEPHVGPGSPTPGHHRPPLDHQPMTAPTLAGTVAFVDGETYNFRELRTELLSLGNEFDADSDTEVVSQG